MSMHERLDPELAEPLQSILEAMGGGPDLADVPRMREMMNGMAAAIKAQTPPIAGVVTEDLVVPPWEDVPAVKVRCYRPTDAASNLPALVWAHAGGFALGSIELDDFMAAQLAKDVGCAVVSVDYRLAPENPYPAALHDYYSVLRYLSAQAAELGLRADRIAVGGASAGGNLAAGAALLARDRGTPDVVFQLLIYPVLNDRNAAPADEQNADTLFWNRANNILAWQYYLGGQAGTDGVSEYAAPLRARDLSGLPPAYIPVGDIDLFAEDNAEYARRLIQAGVPTELHIYPGAFHAFDVFAPMARVAQRFTADRNAVLIRALHG